MLADISNFCIGALAKKILRTLEQRKKDYLDNRSIWTSSKKLEQYLEKVKQYFEKYAAKSHSKAVNRINGQMVYKAPLNLQGWSSPISSAQELEKLFKQKGLHTINCMMHFEDGKDTGLWESATWTLHVYAREPQMDTIEDLGAAVTYFDNIKERIFDSVEHELMHMVQFMGFLMTRSPDFGMPPRSVRDEPSTAPWDPAAQSARPEHSFHDNEFYTNLADAINEFAFVVSYIPKELRTEFMKYFIGTGGSFDVTQVEDDYRYLIKNNPFFQNLKNGNPAKWQMAVKRFYQYLSQHPNILSQ